MAVKPGYKQTEVGVIPVEWEAEPCGKLCAKIQDGTHFSPTIRGNDYLYLTSKNVRFGYLDISTADRIDAAQHEAIYKRCDVKHGDLLLTKDGANTGNAALNTLTDQFSLLSSVALLRFDPKQHSAAYFLQQCLSAEGQQRMKDAMSGNAITRLTLEKIRKLRFPVAPLPEQRAIAEALSDVDGLMGGLDRLIAKKRDLKQAAMQQLLTGQTRLPGFHGEWESVRLGDVADPSKGWSFTGGPFGSNLKSSDYTESGVRIIQLQNIGDGEFKDDYEIYTSVAKADELLSCNIYPGEIILSKMGDPVARACIIPARHNRYLMCSDGIRLAVDSSRFANNFVFAQINAPDFRNRAANAGTGSTRKRIGLTELRDLELKCPPSKAEQIAIAEVLSDMDTELAALTQRRDKTRALKQAMMQELLTGRTRLIPKSITEVKP